MSNKEDDNESQGKPGIRVVDRRRFDSAGEEKSDSSNTSTTTIVPKEAAQKTIQKPEHEEVVPNESFQAEIKNEENFTMKESDQQEAQSNDESDISFGSFVLSLATQALMQLGQLKAPDGMSIPVDPAAAQQTIDILAMLQTKTKGNLDAKEEGLLRDALHSLRVAFLRFR